MKAVRDVLPSSDILYFGDIKNAPYGSKSHRELSQLTVAAMKRLRDGGADRIVSACNSVSASLALSLLDASELKPETMIEMVGPTVSYFRGVDARVAVCATEATVNSGMYETAFSMIDHTPVMIAIPELAGAIEFGASPERMKEMVEDALKPHLGSFDVLVLACTHYPLVSELFGEVVGTGVPVFDPAYAVAERAKKLFWPQEVGNGQTHFIITQDSEYFSEHVKKMFPEMTYSIEVVE